MSKSVLVIALLFISIQIYSQVGIGTTEPSSAAMLEVSSQTDGAGDYKGFMPPRVPDESARDAINPNADDEGLMVYVMSERALQIWNGLTWETIHKNESGAYATDLFISEYVEGSLNNKAIEIANFTGSPINLNNYNLFLSRNGGTTTSTIPFISNYVLNHGEVYVIAHTSADIGMTPQQRVNNLDFNGDDAIVLRNSSNDHIDVMGVVGVEWNFGENITLRRRVLHGPNSFYNPVDWIVYGQDTFNGLGTHQYYP